MGEVEGGCYARYASSGHLLYPKVLYLTALAYRDGGDARQSAVFAKKAAHFNGLAFNYGYLRAKAAALAGPSTE
jgi:hypothetical protein